MKRQIEPTTILSPLPNVMVSCGDDNNSNIITIGWTGIVNSEPPRTYVSVRSNRHSHPIISRSGEFVINLVPKDMEQVSAWCGSRSGKDHDKFTEMNLTKAKATNVSCPLIGECPVNIECKVFETLELGTHTMFLADIVAVNVDDKYFIGEKLDFSSLDLSCYLPISHGFGTINLAKVTKRG